MDVPVGPLATLVMRIAQPLVAQGRRELIKRGLKRPSAAAGVLSKFDGPHRGEFSTLGLIEDLPSGITNAQVKKLVDHPTFTALCRQLIAAYMNRSESSREEYLEDDDQPWKHQHERIEDALRSFFAEQLGTDAAQRFSPYFRKFYSSLSEECRNAARELRNAFLDSDLAGAWADRTLVLATVSSMERHLAALERSDRSTAEERARWQQDYVDVFLYRNERIELPDLELRTLIHYSEIFVEPTLGMLQYPSRDAPEAEQRAVVQSLNFAELVDSVDSTVILGDPGAGKTTTSKILACNWSRSGRGVAFLLRVRQLKFAGNSFNLVREIERELAETYQRPAPVGLVEELLLDGSALVIFDGLDELPATVQGREISHVIEAARKAHPLSRFVVTSRRLGYSAVQLDSESFCDYALQSFSDDQVEKYVSRWFSRRSAGNEKATKTFVHNFMQHSNTIPDLRKNPLMLAVICLLHAGYNEIPRSRPRIYQKCVELLLRTWDSHRGIENPVWGQEGLPDPSWALEAFEVLLSEIGYETLLAPDQQNGMSAGRVHEIAVKNLLLEAVPNRVIADALARRMIDLCRGRAWLFTDVVGGKRGGERYAFTHQSFQEYFAAKYLVRHAETPQAIVDAIVHHIGSGRLEIFCQICLSLASARFPSGGSHIYLGCLAKAKDLPPEREALVVEFLAENADYVMLNGDALRSLAERAVAYEDGSSCHRFARHLLSEKVRYGVPMHRMLSYEFAELSNRNSEAFRRAMYKSPWVWELCLQEGVVDLDAKSGFTAQVAALFQGKLHELRRGGESCSAVWLVGQLADPRAERVTRERCVRLAEMLRTSAAQGMGICDAPEPPYAFFANSDQNAHLFSGALLRSPRWSSEAIAGLTYLTLAFCELMMKTQPGVISSSHEFVNQFVEARATRSPERLPRELSHLPESDVKRIVDWAEERLTLFEWVDHDVAVS